MEKQRIVITGLGVVAPNGIGKEQFWKNCAAGVSGIKPITLFDVSKYRCRYAGEISDFQPATYLGSKGLRNLDRTTLLALVAAKLAIDDAKLEITDDNRNDIGVVLGSTMGSVHSISEFDKEGLREGPRYVNPAHFPNTVINSPASQVAIRFGLKGLNTTIATGFTASLDSIGYAIDMLRLGRAKTLLVGGVEELCIQTFLGFYKLGFLVTSQNGTMPSYRPLGECPSGALLGEGAAFIVLETLETATERNAMIVAEVRSYASQFHPACMHRYDPEARGPIAVLRDALTEAQLSPEAIGSIASSANATKSGDAMERKALENVFGSRLQRIAVETPKCLFGETFSAAGALACAAMLRKTALAPVHASGKRSRADGMLVAGFGPTGIASALTLASVN